MEPEAGLRDRKKAQTRQRIADVAAAMFAERGYDTVAMSEVARAADVSEQTVYNYFPTKPDLVLDRAEQIRSRYAQVVRDRSATVAEALEPLLHEDIDRYRTTDLNLARGDFLTLSVHSAVLRRFALEERERQTRTIATSIVETQREVPMVIAHAHAAALVAVIQLIHDQIGTSVLTRVDQNRASDQMHDAAHLAFDTLARIFTPAGSIPATRVPKRARTEKATS